MVTFLVSSLIVILTATGPAAGVTAGLLLQLGETRFANLRSRIEASVAERCRQWDGDVYLIKFCVGHCTLRPVKQFPINFSVGDRRRRLQGLTAVRGRSSGTAMEGSLGVKLQFVR